MATTYTENYHLGKQENHADKFRMDVITANMDIIDEQIKKNEDEIASAKGTYTTLSDRLNAIESEQESQETTLDEDRAAIVEIIDSGAKSIMDLSQPETVRDTVYSSLSDGGVHLSCSNKIWTQYIVSVPIISGKNYTFAMEIANVNGDLSSGYIFVRDENGNNYYDIKANSAGKYVKTFTATTNTVKISVYLNNSATAKTVSLDAYGMLCTSADYAISSEIVPYAMSNRELTEEVETNKNNILSLYNQGVKNIAKPNTISATTGITIEQNMGHYEISGTTGGSQYTVYLCTPTEDIIATEALYIPAAATRTNVNYMCHWKNTQDVSQYSIIGTGLIIPQGCKIHAIYIQVAANTTFSLNADMMICKKAIYDADPTYQPYAMSNAELTAAIQAIQAQLANQ